MSGGPIFPSSIYLGAASGSLFPNFYTAATNTNGAGYDEGIGLVASNAANVTAYLRYFMPPSIPTGTAKIRLLGLANANTGAVKITIRDINLAGNAAPAAANLNVETTLTATWILPDNYNENKVSITSSPAGSDILIVSATFNSNCTLAQTSTWYMPLIWE